MELRDYQIELANKGVEILQKLNIVYLQMMVRTGKTLTALEICKLYGAKRVLFLTKKKAISSVLSDYNTFGYTYYLECINNESMHTIEGNFDIIIHDESHRFGSFPKTSKYANDFKKRFANTPLILLSGTSTPESYSQIFHQFWVSNYSPFKQYINFYKWAKDYVNVKQKRIGAFMTNDYSEAIQDKIESVIKPYCISFTQQEAGFETKVNEHLLMIEMHPQTESLIRRLKKDKVIEGKNEVILADTAVKLMQKVHQLSSGTIKFESGNTMITDYSKAVYIKEKFINKKIAIIYKFKAERDMLIEIFKDNITEDIEEFNTTNKNIIGQILSIREGTNLSKSDCLVFLNIDFSATSYWQARDRMTTKDRLVNDVYFVFGYGGIEKKIYESVMQKKDYTLSQFKKDI
jgi:type I site-specific restriction endonuclease